MTEKIKALWRAKPGVVVWTSVAFVCRTGFKSLLPESLRYIDKELLRASAMDRKSLRHWQDAVEDLYDDAKTRDAIKRDKELCAAYVVVLNGLISNGSAIAYMIRDYYV